MDNIYELVVQFARLWGQKEVLTLCYTKQEEEIAEELKAYDSEELLKILSGWAEDYLDESSFLIEGESLDTVDFFEEKIENLMKNKGV